MSDADNNRFYREPFTYDLSATRDGPLIGVSEGWRVEQFATRVFDTREAAVRERLVELGWTPPEDRQAIHRSGYDAGFYSAGNYFPEQAWERYDAKR